MKGKYETAYYAGYFDGEGMVRIQRGSVMVQIHSCCPHIVRKLSKSYGGNIRVNPSPYPAWRSSFMWRLYGQKAVRFLERLHPFSCEKKQQIKLALKYYQAAPRIREYIKDKITKLKKEIYK